MESVSDVLKKAGIEIGEFKPCAFIIQGLDTLIYLEKDCTYVTKPVPNSNISILYNGHGAGEIVGVQIGGFSRVADLDLKEKVS